MDRLKDFVDWYNNDYYQVFDKFPYLEYLENVKEATVRLLAKETPRNYIGASQIYKPLVLNGLKKLGFPDVNGYFKNKSQTVFQMGHVFEAFIIGLMKHYGLKVTDEQRCVKIDSLFKGHIDCVVDGVLLDVKTMNDRYFKQFTRYPDNGRGYLSQLAFYYQNHPTANYGAFLCLNKENADLALVEVPQDLLFGFHQKNLEKMEILRKISTLDDIMKLDFPELRAEIYKGELTGKYLIPTCLQNSPYATCFFNVYQDTSGYGQLRNYVDVDNPPSDSEIKHRLLETKEQLL